MKIIDVDLKKEYGLSADARLEGMVYSPNPEEKFYARPAVIVVPGGGYRTVSYREKEPIATDFYARNFNVFMLTYACAPTRYPAQLVQLASAVDYIKKNAADLGVDPSAVFAVGFSAGGHLVGCLANARGINELNGLDYRVRAVGLCYPVIFNHSHEDSFVNLLGDAKLLQQPQYKWLNLNESVGDDNPPAFIWHTADDNCVSSLASIAYAAEYAKRKLRYELHVFREGVHGLATVDDRTMLHDENIDRNDARLWVDLCAKFFKNA